ncbi:PREDICTED: homeobox-leucine zipper protein HAT2 [Camelina sativa]|uniref:Homeobox-leucine zipper protein HAT2 n=1 Tax=Camelina sativa TaxID=90675 RepID=A0ABM0Y3R3_CAMSA|nr:PREDICTED: homeobox-leucine zipper protein HAT2 [Camelina sativa]
MSHLTKSHHSKYYINPPLSSSSIPHISLLSPTTKGSIDHLLQVETTHLYHLSGYFLSLTQKKKKIKPFFFFKLLSSLRMMMGKEDLGLSLSLGSSQNHNPLQLNLNHNASLSNNLQRFPWNQTFDHTSDLRKIDVNSFPSTANCEEETGVSSPNSTISSTISGKRSEREGISGASDDHDEITPDRGYSRGTSDEDDDGGETSRKKLRLSKDQSAFLEETFKEHNTLNPKQKLALAKKLNLTARQVEVWFQNRRARTKLKQTEVDCEYLKRCVEKLTEENRRLQKEAMELRTLKLSPQFYGQITPPTTLIMCPSCERVAGPSPSSSNHHHHQNHRPVSINPWVACAGQVAHGLNFEALRPRS